MNLDSGQGSQSILPATWEPSGGGLAYQSSPASSTTPATVSSTSSQTDSPASPDWSEEDEDDCDLSACVFASLKPTHGTVFKWLRDIPGSLYGKLNKTPYDIKVTSPMRPKTSDRLHPWNIEWHSAPFRGTLFFPDGSASSSRFMVKVDASFIPDTLQQQYGLFGVRGGSRLWKLSEFERPTELDLEVYYETQRPDKRTVDVVKGSEGVFHSGAWTFGSLRLSGYYSQSSLAVQTQPFDATFSIVECS